MNIFINKTLEFLASIDNNIIFALSLIPYLVFLYYICKNKIINTTVKIGFSLTILFVFITILFSILSLTLYDKTLVEVDIFHGAAESFLTIADLFVLYGFMRLLQSLEVKNS